MRSLVSPVSPVLVSPLHSNADPSTTQPLASLHPNKLYFASLSEILFDTMHALPLSKRLPALHHSSQYSAAQEQAPVRGESCRRGGGATKRGASSDDIDVQRIFGGWRGCDGYIFVKGSFVGIRLFVTLWGFGKYLLSVGPSLVVISVLTVASIVL